MNLKLEQKTKKVCLIALPILLAAVVLVLFSLLPKSKAINLEGSVELSTTTYYAQVNGAITDVFAEPGRTVKAGDILATLDDSGIVNEIEQLQATLVIKQAKLNQLQNPSRSQSQEAAIQAAQGSVSICEEKLALAKRELEVAHNNLEQQKILFSEGILSQKEMKHEETAIAAKESAVTIAKAELSAAKSNVGTLTYGKGNADEVDAAMADIRLTELQIEEMEKEQGYYTITALQNGLVVSRAAETGTMAVANQRLFELSNGKDAYFVFYLPQEYLDNIAFGDTINLYRMNEKEPVGVAKIIYMDWKAVYPPDDFASASNKNKKSIKVKALIESQETLRVGEILVTKLQKEM